MKLIFDDESKIITPEDPKFIAHLKFEPRDLWVGIYWDYRPYEWVPDGTDHWVFDLYLCVIPCLPLHLSWRR